MLECKWWVIDCFDVVAGISAKDDDDDDLALNVGQ